MSYAPTGRIPTRTELRTGQLVTLVTVSLGVTVMRWSSHPVDVPSAEGDLPFPGGVDARTHERLISLFADSAGETQASFNDLPDLYSLGPLISGGAVLGAARAEYSLWAVGTTYEERDVFVTGHLDSPQYGGERDPVAFTITQRAEENTQEWPPPAWSVAWSCNST